jgi:hypothetical protein
MVLYFRDIDNYSGDYADNENKNDSSCYGTVIF